MKMHKFRSKVLEPYREFYLGALTRSAHPERDVEVMRMLADNIRENQVGTSRPVTQKEAAVLAEALMVALEREYGERKTCPNRCPNLDALTGDLP